MSAEEALWWGRLWCAVRTAAACALVGLSSLYGPAALREMLTYPSFSYVTAILIVSEATVGDALRGCCHVAYASAQVAGPSMLALWAVGVSQFSREEVAAAVVAMGAFVAALPASTPLLCKRIAFGQLVIIFVGAAISGPTAEAGFELMHPTHVAASTALGALASLLALLLPYPRLAYCQVKKGCKLYGENASKRLRLIVEAICAQDPTTAHDLISQLDALSKQAPKLVQAVHKNLGGMAWERPLTQLMHPDFKNLGDKLRHIEIPIKGMEIALSSCPTFPVGLVDQEDLQKHLQTSQHQIALKLEQAEALDAPQGNCEMEQQLLWRPQTTLENIPTLFLLHCMEFLQHEPPPREPNEPSRRFPGPLSISLPSPSSLIFASKCSVSLFLAVLFGLLYNRDNGYWSGLTIAISFTTGRDAIFTVANARGQGTAMGSVYGLLCVFLFRRCMDFRFLGLLPWIIFTGFLIHSRTYGQAGAFSAVIGALLIVGRRGFGPPTDFAITRITETTIGLLCLLLVELLMNPSRAATLAKAERFRSFGALQDCVQSIKIFPHPNPAVLRENRRRLKLNVKELEKFVAEAEMEPSFWFASFNSVCYRKLLDSFSTLINLFHFIAHETEFISEAAQRHKGLLEELVKQMNEDLELLKAKVRSLLRRRVDEATAGQVFNSELHRNRTLPLDIELGETSCENECANSGRDQEKEVEKILSRFMGHLEQVIEKVYGCEETAKVKREMILCLAGFGFCIRRLTREVAEMKKVVKEVGKCERPSTKAKAWFNVVCRK